MSDDPLEGMRARIAQCRRLAASTTDAQAREVLTQMADEGEADLKRLEAQRGASEAAVEHDMPHPKAE